MCEAFYPQRVREGNQILQMNLFTSVEPIRGYTIERVVGRGRQTVIDAVGGARSAYFVGGGHGVAFLVEGAWGLVFFVGAIGWGSLTSSQYNGVRLSKLP
jgi:hypothetical protein